MRATKNGTSEVLGALDGSPVVAVEVDHGEDVHESLLAALPTVVIAVARYSPAVPAPLGSDIALCASSRRPAPRGWVAVADIDAELDRLAERIARWPNPAVVLAQVLRYGSGADLDVALLVESLAYSALQGGSDFKSWLAERGPIRSEPRDESDETVTVERRADELTITLNRPHVRNAINSRMRDALVGALEIACSDPSIKTVQLGGAGQDFSSGGDLDEFGTLPDPTAGHLIRTSRSPARLLAESSQRVTANLHGACIGAGIELAAFAARVRATGDIRCQLPELSFGLIPGSGGTVSIRRRIGRHRTAWLGIGAAVIEIERATEWGLVDETVP